MWLPGAGYKILARQRAFETYRYMEDAGELSGRYVFVEEMWVDARTG